MNRGLVKPRPPSTSEGPELFSTQDSLLSFFPVDLEVLPKFFGIPGEKFLKLLPRRPTFEVVLGLVVSDIFLFIVYRVVEQRLTV